MSDVVQNAEVNLQMRVSGDAPKNLTSAAEAAKVLGKNVRDVNMELMKQAKLIQDAAAKHIEGAKRQQQVHQETVRQLRASGLEIGPGGTLVPRGSAPYSPANAGAGGSSGGGFGAAAMSGMGMLGRVGGMIAAPLAAAATFKELASWQAGSMQASQSLHLSAAHKRRATMEQIPMLGGLAGWLNEIARLESLGPGLAQMQIDQATMGPAAAARGEGQMGLLQREQQVTAARARQRAVRDNPIGTMPLGIDRTSVGGDILHRETQMRLESGNAQIVASREAQAARAAAGVADKQYLGLQGEVDALRKKHSGQVSDAQFYLRHVDKANAGGAEGMAAKSALEAQKTMLELQNKSAQMEQAKAHAQESSAHAAEAERAARQANLGVMKTELDILRQKEQAGSATQTSMGLTNRGQRIQGLAAVRFIRQYGIGMATPDIIQAGMGFDGEYVRKQAENFGASTPEFQAWKREAGGDAGSGFQAGDLSRNRQRQDEIVKKMGESMQKGEEQFATDIAKTVEDGFTRFAINVNAKIKEAVEKVFADLIAGKILK